MQNKEKIYLSEVESVAGCWGDRGANFLYLIISPGLALQNPLGKEILFVVFRIPTCSFVHLFIPYVLSASWILQTTDCRNLGEGPGFCTRDSNGWMPLILLSVDRGEDLHKFSETIIQIVDVVLQTFCILCSPMVCAHLGKHRFVESEDHKGSQGFNFRGPYMPAVHRSLVCRSEDCGLRITGSGLRIAFLPSTMVRNPKGCIHSEIC